MIVKTDAIVLKSRRYRDTSKLVTLYTRTYGKLKGIAKGARETKSKFGGSLEPVVVATVVLYRKDHRELQLISQSDLVKPYRNIHEKMDRLAVGLAMAELVDQLTHDEEENVRLFDLMEKSFDTLDTSEGNHRALLLMFELRLAGIFGFALSLHCCVRCGREVDGEEGEGQWVLELSKGGLLCYQCGDGLQQRARRKEGMFLVGAREVRILERLLLGRIESIPALMIDERTGNVMAELTRLYLCHHFEQFRPLKSEAVFHQMSI